MSEINQVAYEQTDKLNSASVAVAADLVVSNQSGNDRKMTLAQLATFMSSSAGIGAQDITLADGVDLITDTANGSNIGTASGQKIGFYGVTPVVKGAALTAIDTATIDATYGSEEQGVLSNIRVRLNEFEARMQAFGPIN